NCGTENNKPEEQRSCDCTENWECSWSICLVHDSESYAYDCIDLNNCGTEDNIPTTRDCAEKSYGCDVNWNCTDWGECESYYTLKDLLENREITGIQRRECIDTFGCADRVIEKRICNLGIDIKANKTEWCSEIYIEVYDKSTNKLVSRVKESEETSITGFNLERIDISFLLTSEFTGYCDYCYNGEKDYDEEGIDCGGPNCQECVRDISFFDWLFWLLILLWASVVIFSTTVVWEERFAIVSFIRELRRRELEEGMKGVEEMAYYQKPRLYPRIINKEKGLKYTFSRIFQQPSKTSQFGSKNTEKGINIARAGIESKSKLKDVGSYKEQQQAKKQWSVVRKLREFFGGEPKKTFIPKEKFQQIKRKPFGTEKAKGNIGRTRGDLHKKF
ncbi:MAG TPA: hypothetical protein VJ438_05430, partial [Candidatus Nanoarchaeia archaeon]|nr:hypothetical protein [Candidatus Nanoarchaeia archaeon]